MYYVNREQIDLRLKVLPEIIEVLGSSEPTSGEDLLHRYAKERALHLALEVVTDVGSYLIDGFIMRDASSYEDIIDIIHDEKVIGDELVAVLKELVRLRKPLVQEYYGPLTERGIHTSQLTSVLEQFAVKVQDYLDHELAL
ncbi:DUF86 domain-containing protein [Paenibacillus physcomitrellae]|uniref:DUF86 domain-containing protein n=1 Tax=Paenibacillus physcomitrellae TaxID=1619311 RepID=A0ABQ1GIY4_9BACL|nr:HepT-like ribonuclease domain-containing protein [Paenibacillus physcomitrellae]GGA44870.1 hypothetical protein GCM10010917_32740 [Paenibacillus physcomitrellae]